MKTLWATYATQCCLVSSPLWLYFVPLCGQCGGLRNIGVDSIACRSFSRLRLVPPIVETDAGLRWLWGGCAGSCSHYRRSLVLLYVVVCSQLVGRIFSFFFLLISLRLLSLSSACRVLPSLSVSFRCVASHCVVLCWGGEPRWFGFMPSTSLVGRQVSSFLFSLLYPPSCSHGQCSVFPILVSTYLVFGRVATSPTQFYLTLFHIHCFSISVIFASYYRSPVSLYSPFHSSPHFPMGCPSSFFQL